MKRPRHREVTARAREMSQDLNPGWLASPAALLATKLRYLLCSLLTSRELMDPTESQVLLGTVRTKEMEEAGRSHFGMQDPR